MEQFDIEKQSKELQSSTLKAIKGLFPVKTKTGTLRLASIWADDRLDPGDIQSQLKAKNNDRTWGVPIYGTFELTDSDGKVTQRKDKVRLVTLPKPTPRMSYIINGSEHQISNQLRLRPAGYAVRTGPGGIKGQINLSKGYSGQIELHMNPETGVMRTKIGQANQRLYPILNALGLSDSEMARRWGQDVLDANKDISKSDYDSAVKSFAKSLLKKDYKDTESASQELRKFILGTEMDPKINQRTLGEPHKNMSAEFLADLGAHVLGTVKGDKEPHDRNALEYKEYRKLTDLIEERLALPEFRNKITRKIQYNISGKDKIEDMIHPAIIGPDIKAVFNLPELHQRPDQLNPIDMWNTATRVTIMGPGGIQSEHQVTDDMRDVHPSHLGFLDPVHTPEGSSVGYVYHLPFTVTSKGKTLLTRAINTKTNKLERIDPATFSDSVVAFPGQYDRKSKKWKDPKKVVVLDKGNKTKTTQASRVDYTLESPKQSFSMSSNLIPFLETNSGGRTLVASKMAEQAVPLKEREKPLVQSKVGGNVTFEDLIGDAFTFRSPVDGIVSKVSNEEIVVQGKDGKKRKVQIYNDFPLNSKSFISSDVKVKKGDIVSKDQIISDTNFTSDGSMALGKNLVTAYVPYKGYNFEDGIVITDTAAKKLTSEHMHLETAQTSDRFDIHKRRFVAHYPNVYTRSQVDNVDDDGVVKKGTVLQPGDPIITRLRKDEIDPENLVLGKLSRTLVRPWKDDSISWHGDTPGVVTSVVRHGNKVKVYVKTEEPANIGDKLVGRYGNKGVIGKIIPEEEAPKTKNGTPADIILNPHGIITRINVGQVLENAASKVAEKTGKTYVTDNFSDKNSTQQVKDDLAKNGLTDLEEMVDPVTGKSLGKVNVGKTYIMKLKKQVRSQFSARGAGPGWRYSQHTQEPVKGGEEGSKSMDLLTFYSMLAHGSRCFLGSTPVRLSDGSRIQISDIVKNRLPVKVKAFDGEKIVDRDVVAYSARVANPEELVCVCVVTPGGTKKKHRRKIKCTAGHEFYTSDGKIQAGDLSPGDILFTPGKKLHPVQREMIIGSSLGDGSLSKSECFASTFMVGHCEAQIEYCEWKRKICSGLTGMSKLSKVVKGRGSYSNGPQYRFWTKSNGELTEIRGKLYPNDKKEVSIEILDEINELGLSVWFMDDGDVCLQNTNNKYKKYRSVRMATCSFSEDSCKTIVKWLSGRWGIESNIQTKEGKYRYIHMFNKNAVKFMKIVAPFIVPCMEYKLKLDEPNNEVDRSLVGSRLNELENVSAIDGLEETRVLEVAPYEPKYYEDYIVYNIEVEEDHNYFANGILVGNSNLREMASIKGTKNDDFWNALKTGSLLPSPKPTFAYNKFLAYMKGAGVDVKQEGSKLTLAPMTDREIDNLSNGSIKDPQFIRAKDLEEKPGGLMDKKITGGLRGEKWSHIQLDEPIVNPIFEQPVRTLLDMNKGTYNGLIEGRLFVDEEGNYNEEGNGATGGKAIQGLLSQVNKEERLKEFTDAAKKARSPSALNKANHGIRYIEALKKFNLEPKEAYILNKVPVLPPVFRPIYALPDGNLHTSPVNYLYRDLGLANQKLKALNSIPYMPEDAKQDLRKDIYKGTAAVQGLANPITFYPKNRPVRGIIEEIKGVHGAGSKTGFFQKHVLRREQDLVGRGTIIPEPKLGVDEAGIPEEMAWTIFRPFIIRELVNQGYKAVDADKQVDERSFIAKKALEAAMNERPVLLNRAPSLHKFSIMAFKPKIMAGRAIKIPPLVVKGFNADHDGNCVTSLTRVTLTLETDHGTKSPSEVEKEIEMKFGSSSKVIGTIKGGIVFETNIGDFPYVKGNPKIDKNGAETYSVQNGISVLSIDKETWKPSFEKITGFTVDRKHSVVDVKTRRGYEVSASDNESLCVYNHETGDLEKRKPSESIGMFCPVVKRIPSFGEKYDYETGWMIGAFASDGFFMGDRENVIGYSKKSTESRNRFADAVSNFEGGPIKRKTYKDFHDATKDIQGESIKDHLTIDKSVRVFKSCYHESIERRNKKERASLYKKLPDISLFSEDALFGVFSGLLDGDGTLSWSHGKSKPQLVANIGTSSPYLAESIKSLCRLLGVRFSQSQYGPKEGRLQKNIAYLVSLSIVDIYKISSKLRLTGKNKAILEEFRESEVLRDDRDVVPVPFQIIQRFASKMHPAFKKDTKLVKSLISIKSSRKPPYVSRPMAKRMLPHLECENSIDKEWERIVLEEDTMWDAIVSVDGERVEDVYDFVVPSSKIFAVNDGLVVYDTMHVHVPIMPKAVTEAQGMLPSKHLFNPGTGNIMVAPSQEAAIGLYFLTKDGKSIKKSFAAVGPLQKALENKEINISDMVMVAGKKTSAGRAMVDAVLPKKYQGRNQVLDKKGVSSLLTEIAQNDPKDYAKTVHDLSELGNEYAYARGFTVGIDDIDPDLPEKDALFAEARQKAKSLDDDGVIKLYSEVDKKAKKIIEKKLGEQNNNLYQMVRSGARGNMDQLKQIVSAPLLFEDVGGNPLPIPVESSFSKGLSMSEYWNSMYGARKGSVDAKLQTAKPGEFNKDLMSTAVKNVIAEEDCGTDRGVDFSIDDVEAQDRILTSDVKIGTKTIAKSGDVITSNMISKLRLGNVKKIKARSPLTCNLPKGTCAKCYGLDTDGRLHAIGDNLGAIAGQSLTEPLTQMVLRSKHHGGVAGGTQLTGYEKIDKLIHMPKVVVGKATLAEKSGKVSNIEDSPAGGKNVFVDDVKHFVAPQNSLKVRIGAKLKKGDPLSDGIIHPRDLVRLKGMESAQNYLVDEISSAYKDTGIGIKRKNIEAVIRSVADTTKVLDGGDSPWLYGDTVSYNAAEAFNRTALGKMPLGQAEGKPLYKDHGPVKAGTKVGKKVSKILEGLGYNEVSVGPDPIVHKPFLDGIKQLPMLSKDWMAQMGYGHLVRGIKEGAGQAWETDIHDYSPIPAFAYGAEFGMGQKGKY